MLISCVEKNKNSKMLSVFIDGSYAFSIHEDDYLRLGLYDKSEISKEEIDYIREDVNFRSAKSQAIKYISLKLLSEMELVLKLRSKGYDEEIIVSVIDGLKVMGYINDKAYAQKFVNERAKLKPKSKKMLKMELQKKGIHDNISDEILDNFEYDESIVIEALVRKKFGKYDLNNPQIIKKVYSFLLNRGFSIEDVKHVLNKM